MAAWKTLGTAHIPNSSGQLSLSQRGNEFSIAIAGVKGELMNSKKFASEQALATLGCAQIESDCAAKVLVGGLGMGYTLAATLDAVSAQSQVTVAELISEVVEWNQGPLGECAGQPLQDPRTQLSIGDIADIIEQQQAIWDAILLDIDNGPSGMTHSDNNWLYSSDGLECLFNSLKPEGVLAVWSAGYDPMFDIRLKKAGFKASNRSVKAHSGKSPKHTIFIAQKPWQFSE